jgi:hypothetical protein
MAIAVRSIPETGQALEVTCWWEHVDEAIHLDHLHMYVD